MNLWIVTIGSSDVQLDSDKVNQEKGRTEKQRSDKIWGYWYSDALKAQYHDIIFEPKPLFKDKEESYRIAPRILGAVYNASPDQVQQEILSYLTFPLLDNFVEALKQCPAPETLAVLLTDQSAIFQDDCQRRKPMSPYWQDTCELKLILQDYFENKFPCIPCEWIILDPVSEDQRLDGWDQVLQLVQTKFSVYFPKKLPKDARVYVSHQAGTPAISSAVQFCSLARFGDHVRFLVSNEYNQELTDILPSSNYLIALKQQQAVKLLERYDYSAIQDIYSEYLSLEDNILLEASIQWNFAHFTKGSSVIKKGKKSREEGFVQILKQHPEFANLALERVEGNAWWWTAYEAAYLGFIRLVQENTVEAMFHSFRSVEGLLKSWADHKYPEEVSQTKHPRSQENERWNRNLRPYGEDLYIFLSLKKNINQEDNFDIWLFGNEIFGRRNELFHNIKSLNSADDVFKMWRSSQEKQWKDNPHQKWKIRVLNCLNFIAKDDLPKEFGSLEEASLMVKVHQELERAIADL